MSDLLKTIAARPETLDPYILRLERLYAEMDQAYMSAARHYRFACNGCEDSCCRTRFYHFSFIEQLYLYDGYRTLSPSLRHSLRQQALTYTRQMDAADEAAVPLRKFCPLNTEGACLLYPWRPMICRLHGIPHELHTPGKSAFYGSGCAVFARTCGHKPYAQFDRTPFYRKLAAHEGTLRKEIGANQGIRMTVAMMLLDFEGFLPETAPPKALFNTRKMYEIP